jgi:eukaryotic-like serine/threonine-protein kinase
MPPESKAPPVAVGEVLAGKYRVERVIGEGGMGVVVAAKHLQLDSLVALKFILQDKGQAVERFIREARSAVRLKSEHVARVSDVGTLESGMPYMVMEYLEGRDLSSVLASKGPLPITDAVGYVVHACEAIAEAHGLGIVHRDLKPHNLFLTSGVGGRPKVKVLDFGISKTSGAELALTRSTEIVGTPVYMSPEQLRSARDVDLRTDIWAIGVVLYELLTARLPFEADTLPQLCTMVLSDTPVSPSVHRPEVPLALSAAVLRCLQREPGERFADVAELVLALAPFTPEWAPAHAVLEVPRSSSGSVSRAIIASPSGAYSKTDAAWSETELATPSGWRWKGPLRTVGFVVAGLALLGIAWNMGATYVRRREGSAPTPSISTTAVVVTASPSASNPVAAPAAPAGQASPSPPPSASAAPDVAASGGPSASTGVLPSASAPRRMVRPKPQSATAEPGPYDTR